MASSRSDQRTWTMEDEHVLSSSAGNKTTSQIAQILGRSNMSVICHANYRGISLAMGRPYRSVNIKEMIALKHAIEQHETIAEAARQLNIDDRRARHIVNTAKKMGII